MSYFLSFIVAIAARIVGYYVCKWLNSHGKSDN